MTFTELLSLMAFVAPVVGSSDTGWRAGSGVGLLIGLIVGSVFGVGSFFGVRVCDRWIGRHPKLSTAHPGAFWIGLSWFLCAALIIWIGGVSVVGLLFTKLIIRHVAA